MSTDHTRNLLKRNIDQCRTTLDALIDLAEPLDRAARAISDALLAGHKLLTCGNGGSAADASHIATEFVSRFKDDRLPVPAISLNEVGSTLTAIVNDYGPDELFARQVRAFARPGDILLVITTSGNSDNIIHALHAAKHKGITTIALLGRDGGRTAGLADIELTVPGDATARIQEAHTVLYHTLCEHVDTSLPRQ